jgi:hypothetical protein
MARSEGNKFKDMNKANLKITNLDTNFYNSDVIRKLSLLMDSVVKGDDTILTTPYLKGDDGSKILEKFDKLILPLLSSLDDKVLYDLEMSQRSKFGPRSRSLPWVDRKPNLLSYFDSDNNKLSELKWEIDSISSKFTLRPISYNNAVKLLKSNTNSGLPYVTRKGNVLNKYESQPEYFIDREDPCLLFTRTQEDYRTRDVWGFPAYDTIREMMYYSPLLNFQKQLSWRSAIVSPESTDLAITSILIDSAKEDSILLSLDVSGFDRDVKLSLQKSAFNYIKSLFQKGYHNELDYLFNRFNTIGIVTPDGVFSGSHGIPSGSTFTNEVGSIVNRNIALSTGVVFRESLQCQGDDMAVAISKSNTDKFFDTFETAGLSVNKEKSFISENYLVYLQKYYNIRYLKDNYVGGIYSIYRALNRILYQERWYGFEDFSILGRDYYSIRTISILENCKHHPLFKELVKFVLNLDKYNLDYSVDGLIKYVSMLNETSGIRGIFTNQYGDNLSGINNFQTVKLIKELA